jgi:hypothetical protein
MKDTEIHIRKQSPPSFHIYGKDNRLLLEIRPDGTVIGEVCNATEAGKVFCDYLENCLKLQQTSSEVDNS